jgi:hypothetical protein
MACILRHTGSLAPVHAESPSHGAAEAAREPRKTSAYSKAHFA